MEILKVKGEAGLVRDVETQAILNTDNKALANYKKRKKLFNDRDNKIESLENDINNLKNTINGILIKIDG